MENKWWIETLGKSANKDMFIYNGRFIWKIITNQCYLACSCPVFDDEDVARTDMAPVHPLECGA